MNDHNDQNVPAEFLVGSEEKDAVLKFKWKE